MELFRQCLYNTVVQAGPLKKASLQRQGKHPLGKLNASKACTDAVNVILPKWIYLIIIFNYIFTVTCIEQNDFVQAFI